MVSQAGPRALPPSPPTRRSTGSAPRAMRGRRQFRGIGLRLSQDAFSSFRRPYSSPKPMRITGLSTDVVASRLATMVGDTKYEDGGSAVKTKAAILWERNTPWSVEEIDLDPPKAGEVLVKLAASGMCHSDEHVVTGDLAGITGEPPCIGGHEGAGVVMEVGAGRHLVAGRRSCRVLVPAGMRQMPELRLGTLEPVRSRRHHRDRDAIVGRHHSPSRPRAGPAPRHRRARNVRPSHRDQRSQLHQDREGMAARSGLPAGLRCGHRLGFGGLRGAGDSPATWSPSWAWVASGPTPFREPSWQGRE